MITDLEPVATPFDALVADQPAAPPDARGCVPEGRLAT
jgi:hypothetical protein